MPRPSKWLETEPPEVNWSWPVLMTESSILCLSVSWSSSATIRGSTTPSLRSFCASASSTRFSLFNSACAPASPPPDGAGGGSTGAAAPGAGSTGAAAPGAGSGATGSGLLPPSTWAGATPVSGRSLAEGRSLASSAILETASLISSACLVSGSSAAAIFAAASSAGDGSAASAFAAAASLAASAASLPPAAAGSGGAAGGGGAAAGAPAALPVASAAPSPFAASGGGSTVAGEPASAPWSPRSGSPTAGRFTRLSTSPTSPGSSSRCGSDVLAELVDGRRPPSRRPSSRRPGWTCDSRTSSVIIALPAPSAISSASSSSPASRQALAGSRRKSRAEGRVGEQPLDQLGRDLLLRGVAIGQAPRTRFTSGLPRTTKTGMKSASQSVTSTVHTT